jgi:glycosyltransferase involved in cell wall biosynthesis
MKNILVVFYSQVFSGAEINLMRLIKGCKSSINPIILCSQGSFADNLVADGYTVHTTQGLSSLLRSKNNYFVIFYLLVRNIISLNYNVLILSRKYNIKIIQTNNLLAGSYVLPAIILQKIFRLNIRHFWYNRDIYYKEKTISWILKHLNVAIYKNTFVLSNAVKSTYNFNKEKIIVLPNGLDEMEVRQSSDTIKKIRNSFMLQESGAFVIGIFGAISERKGHHLLIEAFHRLSNEHKNLFLLILGDFKFTSSAYENKILNEINSLDYACYRIEKWTDDIWNYYGAIDILVNATTSKLSEAFGSTIFEAMACGRIVVAAQTGGIPEIVENDVTGFLFQPDDVDSLTDTLRHVINNYSQLDIVRTNAIAKVKRDYDMEVIACRYMETILHE